MKEVNIMIDLETLGTCGGYAILSIGACTFDRTETFYERISTRSSEVEGFKSKPGSLEWWEGQDPSVKEEAFSGLKSVRAVLGEFNDWLKSVAIKNEVDMTGIYPWGNGSNMDIALLESAYDIVNFESIDSEVPYPFYYKNARCYRTLRELFPEYFAMAQKGIENRVAHHALEDAKYQAEIADFILRRGE